MTEQSGGGLDDRYEREGTAPPLTKEQIEGHILAIKSIIKDYNQQNKADPIRLDFGTDNIPLKEGRVARGKDVDEEDLSKPFKEKLKTPLTRRIIEFAGPEYVMPTNITLYDGSTDPADHLNRFSMAANSGEWPMPVWCRMFQQTLDGGARGWFESLPLNSINEWAHPNETLPVQEKMGTVETGLIMGVPEVMKISSFMDSIKSPELAKRFSSNIPKTVDEMMRRVDEFVRAEEAYARTELPPGESRDIHRRLSFPTGPRDVHQRLTFPTSTRNDRDNRSSQRRDYKGNDYKNPYKVRDNFNGGRHRDYRAPYPQRDQANKAVPVLSLDSLIKCPKEILATETQLQLPAPRPKTIGNRSQSRNPPPPPKVINMVRILSSKEKKRKDREATEAWMNTPITFPGVISDDASDEPLIIEAEVEGYLVRRVYVDEGSSVEVMFEHCFENLPAKVRAGLRETRTDLVGFAGEVAKPLGKIDLEVCFGNEECRLREGKQILTEKQPEIHEAGQPDEGADLTEQILVFAWEPSDMTEVPRKIIEHSLNVNPSLELFCQKRRTFSPKKSKDVTNEVAEWARAGIVCPVKYPTYISNPVLCQESEWIMDAVEAVMGFKYKFFLDAYKGYHQIQMAREDKEKTSFYTEQKKRDILLLIEDAIWNLEAYVDDMVIKSKDEKDLLADIAETFENLKAINMKLNPKKCSFGVEEGKFLGYMVTSEGIRANPKKTKAISDLTSPKTLKEMQRGESQWKASFVKSVPGQAEEAFQQMKRLIISLPSLTPPFPKETLYAYLAVAKEAVSAVLLTDRNGRQCPVQYVSRTLNDAEKNYSPLEKLALSLVNMTRRLRRYFEAHPVKVITDQPIKNILSRTEASGKLAKYAVEIGTYKISFLHLDAIKGQVLADFLSDAPDGEAEEEYFRMPEVPPEVDDTEVWTLFTDGAASLKGSGAGLVLIGPSGLEYTYALRLTFVSTNNEAEYEALLAGLRIARKMKVSGIEVKVDSKLVANQINGTYEATKESMIKYLAKAKEFISEFKTFSIENIPREDNQKADILSKLATVPFSHLTKEILVEVLNERSTDAKEVQTIVEEEGENWMTPIIKYLEEGIVPSDKNEARSLRAKISQYVIESGVLFKKGYLVPMLRCVGPLQANYIIREIHMGSCGMHIGPRAVVRKAMRQGYYWPTMHADAKEEVDKCDSCQIHSPIPRLPKTHMTSIMAPWPFYQWGMDILGPLTPAQFGLPRIIVTDNGAQLVNEPFKGWCTRFKIQQMNTSVAHPQANGLVGKANRSLMEGIKTRLGKGKSRLGRRATKCAMGSMTQIKQSNNETPFSLTYRSEAVILAEIGIPSYRTLMIREEYNEEEQRLNLDLLQERREAAAIREAKYKTKMEQYYNKRVRPAGFRPGEFVYRRNEASRMEDEGKLGPN
ncbi:reverse transcriptase domain-containing protein [Tanacetum coccineum]|uniref:Reverse transcriptase domain-containing protein n=1 Tax=Tanacetum coccineum TaxID=301880 RepID=A0ABQ4WTW9_9ASTR